MSKRGTSEYFESDGNYQKYLNQLRELNKLPVYSNSTADTLTVSANLLRKPITEELVISLLGLIKYANNIDDVTFKFDEDGFEVEFRNISFDNESKKEVIQNIAHSAVRVFLDSNQNQ